MTGTHYLHSALTRLRSPRRLTIFAAVLTLVTGALVVLPKFEADAIGNQTISISDASVKEGDAAVGGVLTFTITSSGLPGGSTTVNYSTHDGSATSPADYGAKSSSVDVPGNGTATVSIQVVGDTTPEPTETMTITIATAGATISDGEGTGTIQSDDFAFTVADVTITEGDTGTANAAVTISLSDKLPTASSVKYATAPGGARTPEDYTTTTGTASFPANTLTQVVNVPVVGDTLYEDDEAFAFTLNTPTGATIGDGEAAITILDNDRPPAEANKPALSVLSTKFTEPANTGDTAIGNVSVQLDKTPTHTITVKATTSDGTANAGQDYTATSVTLTFAPGATSAVLPVTLLGDDVFEGTTDEDFIVTLTQVSDGAKIAAGGSPVRVGIMDGDARPTLSVSSPSSDEGTSLGFLISLSKAAGIDTDVRIGTVDGTAKAPGDYTAYDDSVHRSIPAGQLSLTVNIPAAADAMPEPDETFSLGASQVTDAEGHFTTPVLGVGTIHDTSATALHPFFITTGAGPGGGAHVRTFNANGVDQGPAGFFPGAQGPGIRVARGDIDGDGHDEFIVSGGPTPGTDSTLTVYNPAGNALIAQTVVPYPGFQGGLFVAAGDINGDGKDEIITAPGAGGGPHVRVFAVTGEAGSRQLTGTAGFFGTDASFTGGLTVAAGDVTGDGNAEIIVGDGAGGQSVVSVWNYALTTNAATLRKEFLAYPGFKGGVHVSAGDLDGDHKAEIVTGAGPGGGPHVRVFSGEGGGFGFSQFVYPASFTGGVWVAVGDLAGDGNNQIITGAGAGGGPHVKAFNLDGAQLNDGFFAYDGAFNGGVFVSAGRP